MHKETWEVMPTFITLSVGGFYEMNTGTHCINLPSIKQVQKKVWATITMIQSRVTGLGHSAVARLSMNEALGSNSNTIQSCNPKNACQKYFQGSKVIMT